MGLDAAILMNREVWVASGHVGGFNDPLMDCKACKARFRADKLIEDFTKGEETGDGWTNEELEKYIAEHDIVCPVCGKKDFTGIRQFNLMFKTHASVTENATNEIYLRPETAQGIFVNFPSVMRSTRKKLPAGIAQIGKSFRNEITPGNFIFRVREFEQMELEFFCKPGEDLEWFNYWRSYCRDWLLSLGMQEDHLRLRDHEPEKLAFYSKATTDFEFLFPFGWGELWGVADRTDYDPDPAPESFRQEHGASGIVTNEKYILLYRALSGVDRAVLAFLCNAYEEQELEGGDAHGAAFHQAGVFSEPPCPCRRTSWARWPKRHLREAVRALWWTTTRPAPSASATAVRMRSARRSASAWTSRPKKPTVTIRDRDTMQQEAREWTS